VCDPSIGRMKNKRLGIKGRLLIFWSELDNHRGAINVGFGTHEAAADTLLVSLTKRADFIADEPYT
jgi:hypothetical protein